MPNPKQIRFLSKSQLNRPSPCCQHVIVSMTALVWMEEFQRLDQMRVLYQYYLDILTGAIRPRQENPKAPTNLISGPIFGTATATITAHTTTDALI